MLELPTHYGLHQLSIKWNVHTIWTIDCYISNAVKRMTKTNLKKINRMSKKSSTVTGHFKDFRFTREHRW